MPRHGLGHRDQTANVLEVYVSKNEEMEQNNKAIV